LAIFGDGLRQDRGNADCLMLTYDTDVGVKNMTSTEETVEGSLDIRWENYEKPTLPPRYELFFARYKNFKSGAQRSKTIMGDGELEAHLIEIHFTPQNAREWVKQVKDQQLVSIPNTMMPVRFLPDYEP
jgi:hypothetical protein